MTKVTPGVPIINEFILFLNSLTAPKLSENSITVLSKRYLKRDLDNKIIETPTEMFARVAWHLASCETNQEHWAKIFYDLMSTATCLPNSPTLFNAGTGNGLSLSACNVLVPEDSLESIMQVCKDAALVQKAGGGVGYDFSKLRPKGSAVKSCFATTDGPLPFIDMYCWAIKAIQQGAKRRGAQMGMMWMNHPDIWDFIHAKQDLDRWQNMNISVKVTDKWMDMVVNSPSAPHLVYHEALGYEQALVRQEDGSVKPEREFMPKAFDMDTPEQDRRKRNSKNIVTVREVYDEICKLSWENGEPGFAFWDTVNDDWMFSKSGMYPIEATNPCGEIAMQNGGTCNLASINLTKFVRPNHKDNETSISWLDLEECVTNSIRMLDNVVEVNKFPVEILKQANDATRRIGLGVMGWSDALFMLGIPYSSEEARDLGQDISGFISRRAKDASENLADEKGAFPDFDKSDYNYDDTPPVRNAYRTMIAPTGSVSVIAGCSAGIEPCFALAFTRKVMKDSEGKETVMYESNSHFERTLDSLTWRSQGEHLTKALKSEVIQYVVENGTIRGYKGQATEAHGWSKLVEVFETANEISYDGHILMQSSWQKHVDQGISKTINLPEDAPLEDLSEIFITAWKHGCKGITVYRDGCRNDEESGQTQPMQVEKKKIEDKPSKFDKELITSIVDNVLVNETKGALANVPEVCDAIQVKQRTPVGTLHMTVVCHKGEILEIFGQISKAGEQSLADTEAICRLASLVLRLGGGIDRVLKQLEHIGSTYATPSKEGQIKSIPDGVAVALKKARKFIAGDLDSKIKTVGTIKLYSESHYKLACPDCGSSLKRAEGCLSCSNPSCGFAKC